MFLQAKRFPVMAFILLLALASSCSTPDETSELLAWSGTTFQVMDGLSEPGTAVDRKTSLTIDGNVIRFRQADGKLLAYDGPEQIWETEPDLMVDDFLVADPDNDGAEEVIFSLWKNDPSGHPGSEFWIYGCENGRIRAEWCGSAVADPIRDFTVSDLDEDGSQELIVLEGSYNESRESPGHWVTIWRWNGWGFTNIWRSSEGNYTNLEAIDSKHGDSPVIQVQFTH